MNKKGFAAMLALLLLTLLLLAGLSLMTARIVHDRAQSPVMVTATPEPTYEDFEE